MNTFLRGSIVTCLAGSAMVIALTACTNTGKSSQTTTKQAIGTGIGAAVGYIAATAMHVSNALKILFAAGGAAVGHTIAGIEAQSKPITLAGGQVYQVGDYVSIVIPSALLFRPGKDTLSLQADKYLSAAAAIIAKYPTENVLVTSSTGGLFSKAFDLALSQRQAARVAAGLWGHGVNSNDNTRKVNYAGLGDEQPISDAAYAKGIDHNRRIQITLYPSKATDKKDFSNIDQIGAM